MDIGSMQNNKIKIVVSNTTWHWNKFSFKLPKKPTYLLLAMLNNHNISFFFFFQKPSSIRRKHTKIKLVINPHHVINM